MEAAVNRRDGSTATVAEVIRGSTHRRDACCSDRQQRSSARPSLIGPVGVSAQKEHVLLSPRPPSF